jgi:hypothetical protein
MLTVEGVINKLEQNVHKLWECDSELFKLEKSALEAHLLLLQLITFQRILRV